MAFACCTISAAGLKLLWHGYKITAIVLLLREFGHFEFLFKTVKNIIKLSKLGEQQLVKIEKNKRKVTASFMQLIFFCGKTKIKIKEY